MLKIMHPGAIVREREKRLSDWEAVRTVKYANGVEYHVLIGSLPHGMAQSVISANREMALCEEGETLRLEFTDRPAALMDFAAGDRPMAETVSVRVLDACHFLPDEDARVVRGDDAGETTVDGDTRRTTFSDGTTVVVTTHGHHAHVEATRNDTEIKTFYDGKDNTLYVFPPFES